LVDVGGEDIAAGEDASAYGAREYVAGVRASDASADVHTWGAVADDAVAVAAVRAVHPFLRPEDDAYAGPDGPAAAVLEESRDSGLAPDDGIRGQWESSHHRFRCSGEILCLLYADRQQQQPW
jgi:hypothetical protein